jgi:hypothetical protein
MGSAGASGLAAQVPPDAVGITPIAARAGSTTESQEAARVVTLVRADFPAGAGTPTPARGPGVLPTTPWGVPLALAGNLTRADSDLTRADSDLTHGLAHARLLLARPDLDLTQEQLATPAAER